MNVDHPFHFDASGRTARADADAHIRDMIEQVLFTAPGERVNRPDFGTGLQQLVFSATSDELAAAIAFSVQGALQKWIGPSIVVEDVSVDSDENELSVHVRYTVVRTGERGLGLGASSSSGISSSQL